MIQGKTKYKILVEFNNRAKTADKMWGKYSIKL